jgi:hypothetical protein
MPDAISRNGPRPARAGQARYCAYCGIEVDHEAPPERFGEPFCSEAHAEEFVRDVRAARARAVASGATEIQRTADEAASAQSAGAPSSSSWKRALKMAACCGLPILALVILAGGGGALLGAANAVLPLLLFLACPLAMFFMMRGMTRMGQHDKDKRDGGGK